MNFKYVFLTFSYHYFFKICHHFLYSLSIDYRETHLAAFGRDATMF